MASITSTVTITRIDDLINSMDRLSAEMQRYNDGKTAEIQLNAQQLPPKQFEQQFAATTSPGQHPVTPPLAQTVEPQLTHPIVQQPVAQVQVAQPVQQPVTPAPQPAAIPTSHVAQNYTIEQLQIAMAPLIDAGKMQDIQNLFKSFGVQSIMDLPPEQYGALATAIRGMGAQI